LKIPRSYIGGKTAFVHHPLGRLHEFDNSPPLPFERCKAHVHLVEVDVKHVGFVQQICKDASVSLLDIVLNEAVELA